MKPLEPSWWKLGSFARLGSSTRALEQGGQKRSRAVSNSEVGGKLPGQGVVFKTGGRFVRGWNGEKQRRRPGGRPVDGCGVG